MIRDLTEEVQGCPLRRVSADEFTDRESRLHALRFEDPSAEQRRANLALNVALREWPK